jgi:hypothetical protein
MRNRPNRFSGEFVRAVLTILLAGASGLVVASPAAAVAVTFEERMLELVNGARATRGVAPVQLSPALAGVAGDAPYGGCGSTINGRAADMGVRNYFSHVILNCAGRGVTDMVRAAGMPYVVAENIAYVNAITDPLIAAERLHNDLMASALHRENVVNPAFTHVGVGSWRTAAGASWTGGGTALRNVYVTTQIFVTQTAPSLGGPATDIAVFRPGTGTWFVRTPVPSMAAWGQNGDVPVPGDYNGDGITDLAVFRPSNNAWYLRTPTPQFVPWGASGDIPVPADYDGNGTTDVAVFRPATGTWFVHTPVPITVAWGQKGDIPVPGDYDGNGTVDIAVFRPSNNAWYLRTPTPQFVPWGQAGDIPVPGDYDGNRTTDVAVFRPSSGTWDLRTASPKMVQWGQSGDVPVSGDYDGNGTTEVAVFRPGNSAWYLYTPVPQFVAWGESGDEPLSLPDAIRRFF